MKKLKELFAKNRNLAIAGAVIIVLVVLAGGFLIFKSLQSSQVSQQQTNSAPAPTETPIPSISPSDLGLTLTAGPGTKTVILKITNTQDIAAVNYELSYMATVNGSQVLRGAIGDVAIKQKGQPLEESITLGTCSDVCHYDTGVSQIKLTLKITKTNGMTYQSEISLNP